MKRLTRRLRGPQRREQILGVAAELFARRGFRGTTTREIADHAHINEAIVFRHFPRKEGLYWSILESKIRSRAGYPELERLLKSGRKDEEIFAEIAEGILRRNTQDPSLNRLLLFSALEQHGLAHRFFQMHTPRYWAAIARYIRRRINEGAFRRVDPLLAARGFIGMISYFLQVQELYGWRKYRPDDFPRVCRTLAGIWVAGMREEQPRRSKKHALNGA